MGYVVTIYDTQNELPPISGTEKAGASSVRLTHQGGDVLDQPIIGGSLRWTFIGLDCSDGKYSALFTGDENRFRVELTEDEKIIWTGFLLPDAYKEPYRNFVQDVSFQAVDGLGRLKGKFLDYLPNEVSVVELITRALRLTGLYLNLVFSPAIVNYSQEDFRQIWLDAGTLRGRDAYDTLYGLAASLGCSVFQIDNKWYFEGWNFRNQWVLPYTEYNYIGTFQQAGTLYKNVKDVTVLSGGNVETVPPLGRIEVSYQKELPLLSAELFSVQDQDWIDYEGAADNNEVYARAWLMPEDTPIWASKEKGVYFTPEIVEIEPPEPGRYDPEDPPREPTPDQTAAGSYSIADRPYLIEGYLYRLTFSLRLVVSLKNPPEEGEVVDAHVFGNPLVRATLGGQHLSGFPFTGAVVKEYTYARPSDSSGTTVINEQEGELGTLEFRAQNSGLLNIEIFRLIGLSLFGSDSRELDEFEFEMFVDEISIENIDDVPTSDVAVRDNSEEFTTTKTVELSFAGDPSGSPGAFRLNRTDASVNVEVFSNPSRRHFKLEDFRYYIVDLKTAYLVDKYRDNQHQNKVL